MYNIRLVSHFKLPEHLVYFIFVQSISIIHKAKAVLIFDHNLINQELFGIDIWIIGIVCREKTM